MTFLRSFASLSLLALATLIAPPVSAAPSADDASQYINTLATKTLDTISDHQLSKAQKQDSLEKLFTANVDTDWVGRFVLSRAWNTATDDQKKQYLKQYQVFIVRSYASRFTNYTSGTFKITSSREDGDGEYTVGMQIITAEQQSPVQVDYRLRADKNGYKVFDIIVEGVSMINTQRSEFAAVINDKGLDYLIGQLQVKSQAQAEAATQ